MHEWAIQAIFYIFALLTVLSALMVISQNNPVRCVLFLVLTFFTSAVLWILAEAEFLALILILVYVGAVMTLFLFVVMMLNIDIETMKGHLVKYLPFGLIIVALLTGLLMVAIPKDLFRNSVQIQEKPMSVNSQLMDLSTQDELVPPENTTSNTEKLGMVLYTDYFLAFEIAAVILLVAIVSAITLVHRGAIRSKRQDITQQIMTRRAERVKLISMKPEK
ncbi:NADH-quinone oxidoreductase subunit J [Legionella pneumophila]|uniref:NADH-quinone oxidoreductase subunit J n=1 Tax=Legionella pneumophila subsp. pascullei TaxID=91890 RepID=A0AAX2IZ30_LEGPN|nr:NADH-quinone oxidoreductase subunit J [Legionella pneumophila]AMP90720.1 NADH:ubiquinone oxidoreductase subunit J [Legionella pneumophila subsp. pascullei]AMP93703.1 NADH:ubiquinone oxidoreductase subunit J [Legionella pneumophila subsp. pascullei]AMP96621.1 NADH:ubiquinone oxidoreductase subunit J [Legionella pneumophila subsp. pascullei]SQG91662.1 NADH dehydrogenase I subunit J [Legionella pneumophila subsp. pascullei]VEH08208.1 NADH dehydrogenase I subunit J [Legionella pneumophila subsp